MIRVLIVDDHEMVREGLAEMLSAEPGIEVVGQAASAREAISLTDSLEPDVILMDLNMPGGDGHAATRTITAAHPSVVVIAVTVLDDPASFVEAVRSGAVGYLTKDCSHELLVSALRTAVEGGSVAPVRTMRQAFDGLLSLARPDQAITAMLVASLTPRETEVLGLMAMGHDTRTMRDELFLAEVTVKKHVQSIVSKLGVSNRTQAAILGARLGLDRAAMQRSVRTEGAAGPAGHHEPGTVPHGRDSTVRS